MAKLKTYAFISMMISIFLLVGSFVPFSIGVSDVLWTRDKTYPNVKPHVCMITATESNQYACTCGRSCATMCVKYTWWLECTDPMKPNGSIVNTSITLDSSRVSFQDKIDTFQQNDTIIAFSNGKDAYWSPADSSYGKILLTAGAACIAFLTFILTVSAVCLAHFVEKQQKSGSGSSGRNSHAHDHVMHMAVMAGGVSVISDC